jgi:hypothetical protein
MSKIKNKTNFTIIIIIIATLFTTYFITDILHKSEIEDINLFFLNEIDQIQDNNLNFNNIFLESIKLYEISSNDRLLGNYQFDISYFFYNESLKQLSKFEMNNYKNISLDRCDKAKNYFYISNLNYENSKLLFNNSKKYAINDNFLKMIDLYIKLTESGSKLTQYLHNSSYYLNQMIENITYINGFADKGNITIILRLFNENLTNYNNELLVYKNLENDIELFDIFGFNPKREPI